MHFKAYPQFQLVSAVVVTNGVGWLCLFSSGPNTQLASPQGSWQAEYQIVASQLPICQVTLRSLTVVLIVMHKHSLQAGLFTCILFGASFHFKNTLFWTFLCRLVAISQQCSTAMCTCVYMYICTSTQLPLWFSQVDSKCRLARVCHSMHQYLPVVNRGIKLIFRDMML